MTRTQTREHLDTMYTHRGLGRRAFLGAGGAAALAIAAARVEAAAGLATRSVGSAETILPWRKIAPGVHAMIDVNTGGNVAAIFSDGAVAVVDSKFPAFAGALRADALTLAGHESDAPVDFINTHHHADHSAGNIAFVQAAGTSIAHANALGRIESQTERYQQSASGAAEQAAGAFEGNAPLRAIAERTAGEAASADPNAWVPRVGVGEKSSFRVGKYDLELRHFGPGHTDNDLVVRIEQANTVHTGDLVFSGLHPYFDQSAGVTARGWLESLAGVLEMCDARTKIIPGHGTPGDRSIVENQARYIEQLIAAVRREMDAGKAKGDIAEMTFSFMGGLGFEQARARAINAVYDELASE